MDTLLGALLDVLFEAFDEALIVVEMLVVVVVVVLV